MRKATLLLVLLACLLAAGREGASTPHLFPARVGLVLIAATADGFALAADGSSLNADGRVSQEQRLFQLGKRGALTIVGTVSIQDPVGSRVREEVNIARIAGAWLAAHPEADVTTASRDVNAAIAAALNKFLSARNVGTDESGFKFAVIAAGFGQDKPVLITTRYFMPGVKGKPARAEQTAIAPQPGELWIMGNSSVPEEILSGKTSMLKTFKDEPAVKKFRSAPKPDLGGQDYINLFDSILRAAESDQAKKLDGRRTIVAPPNKFAVVTKDGFTWSTMPN